MLVKDHQSDDQRMMMKHAMSVDVEDYFQVWALSEIIKRDEWDEYGLRVEDATRRVLALFERTNTKATFFTLGWIAERCPILIRDIVDQGHELASHGYEHIKVFDQTEGEFKEDAGKTKTILEQISGVEIKGYRAAGFSIDHRTPWAAEILAGLGYNYSSSLHPIAHDHYSMADAPRFKHHPIQENIFLEIPVSTVEMLGKRFSCAGGGWFRVMPYAIYNRLIESFIAKENEPAVFYFHPWEIDQGQPRVEGLSQKSKFRHYTNLNHMEKKLEKLLNKYNWGRIDDIFFEQHVDQVA